MSDLTAGRPALMLVKEVADLLRVSVMSVYRMIDAGELKAFKARRVVRVYRSSVEKMIEEGTR